MKHTEGKEIKNKYLLAAVGINFFIAFVSLIYFVYKDNGLITLVDDFNAQQIPFNIFANQAIKNGDIFWNWNIDIGSDFVSTFSFYNLGSPFFWVTLLFPATAFPYLMPWIYMLKYAVAGLFAYMFIARFVKNPRAALLGSMLYAFSGFSSCNLVFYHFHDVVALFPLLLIGLEKLVTEKKKGWFAFSVFINALVNYFFFIGEVIFLVIYYVIRFIIYSDTIKQDKTLGERIVFELKIIAACFVEGLIGAGMSAVLLIPSITAVLKNSRVSEHIMASEALTFNTENVLQILKGMFFPADIMNRQSAVMTYNWYSVSAYLPMAGMLLVFVYVYNKKKDWISGLLKTSLVFALVPILNNVFVMFQRELYRRWYYMPVLIMALASALVIDNIKDYKVKRPALITGVIMAFYIAFMKLYPWDWSKESKSGVYGNKTFAILCLIGAAGVICTLIIIKFAGKKLYTALIIATAVFCALTTASCAFLYRRTLSSEEVGTDRYSDGTEMYKDVVVTAQMLNKDVLPYRYFLYEWYYNRNLAGYVPARNSFISTVSPSITEFYDKLGEERHVCGPMGPEGTNEILSVGYYAIKDTWSDELYQSFDNGYSTVNVYKTAQALPIGFTYDTYMTESDYSSVNKELRAMAMLKTLIIKDEDEINVAKVLSKFNADKDGYYDIELRKSIINEHKKESSQDFWYNTKGFGSNITADSDKYAFYSVPYDDGWSAFVNGSQEDILNINGLMAVRIREGSNTIEFQYQNKALKIGMIISVISLVIWLTYAGIAGLKERRLNNDK